LGVVNLGRLGDINRLNGLMRQQQAPLSLCRPEWAGHDNVITLGRHGIAHLD
jgi:hypothetical protein